MRGSRRVLPVLAAAVLLTGCGGTTDTGVGAGDTSAAGLVPASAPVFVAVDTDLQSSQLEALDRLTDAFPDKELALDRLRAMLSEKKLDWQQDLAPALGKEVDFAVLDFGESPDIVGLVKPDDRAAFERVLRTANAEASTPSDRLYAREVEGWQVVADSTAKLDRFEALRKQESARLADSDRFQTALREGPDETLARAFVDGPKALAALHRVAPPDALAQLDRLGKLDWLLLSARAEDRGVRVAAVVHGTPGPAFAGNKGRPFAPTLPGRVPAGVIAYYTFHGAESGAAQLNLGGSGVLGVPAGLGAVTTAFQRLAPVLRGEDALYVREGKPLPEITLVAQPGRGVRPTQALDRALAQFRMFLPVRPRPLRLEGRPGRVLAFGGIRVYYVTIGGRLLVSNSRAGIHAFVGGGRKLADDAAFRSALTAAGVGSTTLGYLYVNGPRAIALFRRFAGGTTPIEARNLAPLRSLVEDVRTQSHEAHVSLFLEIGR